MTDPLANGASAPSAAHARTRTEIADDIRLALEVAERELARYRDGLAERELNVKQMRKALEALEPSEPAPKRGPGRPKTLTLRDSTRNVSEQTVELVLRELVTVGEAQSVKQMQDRLTGQVSHDPVRRALTWLRDEGRVRVAGRSSKGGIMYAAMPEEIERAHTREPAEVA